MPASITTPATDPTLAALAREAQALAHAATVPAWLSAVRREAFAAFADLGLPTTRLESWRHTNLTRLPRRDATDAVAGPDSPPAALPGSPAARLVLVDGVPLPTGPAGLPAGLRLTRATDAGAPADAAARLEQALHETATPEDQARAFIALNTALAPEPVLIEIAPGVRIDRPLHLCCVAGAAGEPDDDAHDPAGVRRLVHPRVIVRAGAGSRLVLWVHHTANAPGAIASHGGNAVLQLELEPGAEVEHVTLQEAPEHALSIETVLVRLGADARYRATHIALGAALGRAESVVRLAGDGATATLRGVFAARAGQHLAIVTRVEHAADRGTSRQDFRGIAAADGHGVFDGTIVVEPGTRGNDARQHNPNLLLAEGARINTRPLLRIFADDVACTHGATVGALDAESLFYLQSRGIAAPTARHMLLLGFARAVLDRLDDPALSGLLADRLAARLSLIHTPNAAPQATP